MSADIEKLAVFDSRIVQNRPKYAVQKGALSLTNAPFNAISATPSQHTYNIYVPSENVFVDRAVEWTSTCFLQQTVTYTTDAQTRYFVLGNAGLPLWVPAVDWALPAFPLNSLCSTTTATINDTTSVINAQDVLKEVLRLTDYKKNRLQRTCPTMLDKYQCYDDAYGAANSPLSGYASLLDYAEPQNGQFPQVSFTDALGAPLVNGNYYTSLGASLGTVQPIAQTAGVYQCINGLPCLAVTTGLTPNVACLGPFTFFFKFTSTEKVVLSPFTFSDVHEWDTGLFGINNIQLIMNLQAPTRSVRSSGMRFAVQALAQATGVGQQLVSGVSSVAVAYNTSVAQTFQNSVVNVQFLTPSLDVPLPPKSVVPYLEFPRYITNYSSGSVATGAVVQIQSQTITLPQIPDLLIIYVKNGLTATNYADSYMSIASRSNGGIANPLTVNFDNFSGLLSSQTTEQLYAMSIKNGLDMDWATWSGQAYVGQGGVSVGYPAGGTVPTATGSSAVPISGVLPSLVATGGRGLAPTVGSILVLKPSQDITLQTGQAPSLVGNFTLQFNLQVVNNAGVSVTPQLYVITANSGYFESIRGSSRIIKGVLSEQDIIGAPLAPTATTQELHRYVGGAGIFSTIGSVIGKVISNPAVRDALLDVGKMAGKELLHHGTEFVKRKISGGMASGGAMSGGMASGGAMSGGAMSGGRYHRGGLDARLC
jgi:hypothetical protein